MMRTNLITAFKWLLAVALTAALAGCKNLPDEQTMRQALDRQVQEETLGVLEVVQVKKLNAFEPDDRHYRVELAVTYRVAKSVDEAAEALMNNSDNPLVGMAQGLALTALKLAIGERKVGETFTEVRKYEFIRTEQGWQLSGPIDKL